VNDPGGSPALESTTSESSDAATDIARTRAELLALRGVRRVLWSEPGAESGSLGTDADDGALAWLALLAAMTQQMSGELRLGPPHLMTISYADRLVAMAIDPRGARITVISDEPASVGLAMVKLRNWLATRTRGAP
jgi:hypothetical protein